MPQVHKRRNHTSNTNVNVLLKKYEELDKKYKDIQEHRLNLFQRNIDLQKTIRTMIEEVETEQEKKKKYDNIIGWLIASILSLCLCVWIGCGSFMTYQLYLFLM